MSGEIFDVKAALKEHPESEVAAHLAELHGVNRADYIKEGLTDAEFLSEYGSKMLPVVETTSSATQISPEAMAARNDPLNTAVAGTIAGVAAGTGSKTLDFAKAIKNMGSEKAPIDLEPIAPTAPPDEYFAPGQKYSAKTGYGSGPGVSVAETVEHKAEQTAPLGRGKVSSKIKGPASPDEILAAAKQKEADALLHARIIAQEKLKHDQEKAAFGAKQQEYVKKQQEWALRQKALAEEKKFGIPNKIGTTKAVTGASVGYNAMDAVNQAKEGDPAQAALAATGVAGAAAPYIKKLPPKLRAIGTGVSLAAPVINRGIDVVEDFAAGGLAGGGPPLPGKLGKAVNLVQGAANLSKRAIGHFDPRFDKRVGEIPKLKNMVLHTEQQGVKDVPEIYLPDYEGHPFITSISDRSHGGAQLQGINDVMFNNPVDLTGGKLYMYNHPGKVWAAGDVPADNIMRQARALKDFTGKDPLYVPWQMAPTGSDFSHMTGQTMLAYAESAMPKGEKKQLDKYLKGIIPDWKGIDNPESMNQFLNAPAGVRGAVQDLMDKNFRDSGGIGIGQARLAIADPEQLVGRDGSVSHVGRIFADQDPIRNTGNASYPSGIPGEGLGKIPEDFNIYQLLSKQAEKRNVIDPANPTRPDLRSIEVFPSSGVLDEKTLMNMGFAAGGSIQNFGGGGSALLELGKGALKGLSQAPVNRLNMHFKDVIKRTPQITEAARLLKEGKLSREEFDFIVNKFKPVTPYGFVPQPASEAEAMQALGSKGEGKWKLDLPEGHPVGLRLDIPAYKDHGTWVNSIHNEGAKDVIPNTSYSNIAAAKDVNFEITPRNQERFLDYAAGLEGQNKFTGARIGGLWTPMDDKDFVAKSQDALHSKDWAQIGMDPERHGYFYDRASMDPVASSDEVLQIGPLVLGKNPKYGNKKDSLYKKGGLATLKKKK